MVGHGFDGERKREKCDVYIIILFNCVIYIILLLAWVVCGCLWLFSRFCSQLLGRFCGCLWFGGYVNFVEIFGFVIVGFGGFGGFVIACFGGLKLLG